MPMMLAYDRLVPFQKLVLGTHLLTSGTEKTHGPEIAHHRLNKGTAALSALRPLRRQLNSFMLPAI